MFNKRKLLKFTIAVVFALFFILTQSAQASDVFVFNKNLQTGNINTDVKALQKFLNNNGFALSKSGAGSLGQETAFFGSITKNALIKFQKANKIIPAVGYFGPATRKTVNKIAGLLTENPNPLGIQANDKQSADRVSNQAEIISNSGYYAISGSIIGVVGPVVIQNNSMDDLTIDIGQNSNFTFRTLAVNGTNYNVTAKPKYSGQTCYVHNNIGMVNGVNIENVKIACGANLSYNPFTFIFSGGGIASYSLDYAAGAGGTISGAASQTVNAGSSGSAVTAVPDTGYSFVSWSDGVLTAERTDTSITADKTVSATFAINTYAVAFDANGSSGGTKPADQTKTYGVTLALATNSGTLVKTGYTFSGWNTLADGTGTDYAVGADYTANAGATLYAKWTPELAVGVSYQGGKVAYIFQVGDPGYVAGETHGLIVSLADLSTGIYWHATNNGTTNATGTAIGTGLSNTNAIVATYGAETNAARLAYDHTNAETGTGFYSDWYLPSKDELNKLYINRVAIGIGNNFYWSSSELTSGLAWQQWIFTGGQDGGDKNTVTFYVRAIRSF